MRPRESVFLGGGLYSVAIFPVLLTVDGVLAAIGGAGELDLASADEVVNVLEGVCASP